MYYYLGMTQNDVPTTVRINSTKRQSLDKNNCSHYIFRFLNYVVFCFSCLHLQNFLAIAMYKMHQLNKPFLGKISQQCIKDYSIILSAAYVYLIHYHRHQLHGHIRCLDKCHLWCPRHGWCSPSSLRSKGTAPLCST